MQPCTSQFGYRNTRGGDGMEGVRVCFMWTTLSGTESGLDVCRLTQRLKSNAFVSQSKHMYFS